MLDPELLERITARRLELDELEDQLAEVRAERDELAVAERVLERMTGQLAEERSSARPMPGQVGKQVQADLAGRSGETEPGHLGRHREQLREHVRRDGGPRADDTGADDRTPHAATPEEREVDQGSGGPSLHGHPTGSADERDGVTGSRTGIEVVQVYTTLPDAAAAEPRRLVGFRKVSLPAKTSTRIKIDVPAREGIAFVPHVSR